MYNSQRFLTPCARPYAPLAPMHTTTRPGKEGGGGVYVGETIGLVGGEKSWDRARGESRVCWGGRRRIYVTAYTRFHIYAPFRLLTYGYSANSLPTPQERFLAVLKYTLSTCSLTKVCSFCVDTTHWFL